MKKIWLFLFFQTLAIGAVLLILYVKTPHTAFINTNKVYNDFKGKGEYQAKLEELNSKQKHILDTIKYEIDLIELNLSKKSADKEWIAQYQIKAKNYERLRMEFEDNIETQKQKYIEEIWIQINKYVEQYGKQKGYDYIYGTNGSGSIMFAKESKDISKDVTEYINKKYEGF